MNLRVVQHLEETQSSTTSFAEFDVLCGQNKNFKKHPGNKAFSNMIDTMVEPYRRASSKQEKMRLTLGIVLAMKEKFNSRFIEKSIVEGREIWNEIPDHLARGKVSHAIRYVIAHPRSVLNEPSETSMVAENYCFDDFDSDEDSQRNHSGTFETPCSDDVALTAFVSTQQQFLTNIEISAIGDHDDDVARSYLSRNEAHMDSVQSEDNCEFLTEPFLGGRNNNDSQSLLFNSLRSEDWEILNSLPSENFDGTITDDIDLFNSEDLDEIMTEHLLLEEEDMLE